MKKSEMPNKYRFLNNSKCSFQTITLEHVPTDDRNLWNPSQGQHTGQSPVHQGEVFTWKDVEMNLVYAFEPIVKTFPFQRVPCLIIVPYEYEKKSFSN